MVSGIFGLPGSGKSLLLGLIADRAVKGKSINYKSLNIGRCRSYETVYTNFPFNGACKLDFESLGHSDYRDCLILIDEIMMLADSRNFKNFGDNLKFFFSMHRHFNIDLVYASQEWISNEYLDENGKWGRIDANRWNTFYKWLYDNGLTTNDLTGKGFDNECIKTSN